ncbi:MAG: Card1-like endonuclease domain-containing protein, partial [Bacteroidota bacterium]
PQAKAGFFSRLFQSSADPKSQRDITGYYITQKGRSLLFPAIEYDVDTRTDLSTTELLRLSGHKNFELHVDDKPEQDMVELAYSIKVFFDHHPGYRKAIINHYITSYNHKTAEYIGKVKKNNDKEKKDAKPFFPETGTVNLIAWENNQAKPCNMSWSQIEVKIGGEGLTVPLNIKHPQWKYLLLGGGWWEYIVFKAAYDWPGKFSVHRNTIFKFNNQDSDKNEVDILLNTGKKLIFLECKSGKLFPSDVNKMEIVRKLYGGFLSHSALVRYYPLDERSNSDIIERSRDLKIKEISFEEDVRPSLERIINKIHEELFALTDQGRI